MKKRLFVVLFFLILLAGLGGFLTTGKTITLYVDGETRKIRTHALSVAGALRSAGIDVGEQDSLQPSAETFLWNTTTITLEHARTVTLISPALGGAVTFTSTERIPALLGAQMGLEISPADRVLWNGVSFPIHQALPAAPVYILQFQKAGVMELEENGQLIRLESTQPSIGAALWEAGIRLSASDSLSLPLESAISGETHLTLTRSTPVIIKADGQEISTRTSAQTVGQALAAVGISLQGLDYAIPSEDQPMPADGILQVVRVREEIALQQSAIPFDRQFVENPEVELDQRSVVEAGHYGVEVTRLRTQYNDGQEVSRQIESQWVAVEPRPEKVGYGTKIVIRTLDTPSGPIEYWRAVPVYATAYSPCRSGTTKCYFGTSSGRPVQRGVIGVTRQWYSLLANQPVYVPGYGTGVIADIGGGSPGKYWIDLGFTDEDFEPWHQDTILYFLTPVPASVPWILP
ncbi:MAG: DUF348 domain-containing protein [Anaerolineaceae bacterium]|nr:DUF348 domain-containing protein [Anaerolineaceae bacterium]